jgi:hypothetical protein
MISKYVKKLNEKLYEITFPENFSKGSKKT